MQNPKDLFPPLISAPFLIYRLANVITSHDPDRFSPFRRTRVALQKISSFTPATPRHIGRVFASIYSPKRLTPPKTFQSRRGKKCSVCFQYHCVSLLSALNAAPVCIFAPRRALAVLEESDTLAAEALSSSCSRAFNGFHRARRLFIRAVLMSQHMTAREGSCSRRRQCQAAALYKHLAVLFSQECRMLLLAGRVAEKSVFAKVFPFFPRQPEENRRDGSFMKPDACSGERRPISSAAVDAEALPSASGNY